ncbi:MAG: rRNA maturation RNase YbeY [Clostridiales bacterium]|jgi:probable rRNA maturation factor|nr:rRNA maturation RNase YbeY [Clostridiales bacterium]
MIRVIGDKKGDFTALAACVYEAARLSGEGAVELLFVSEREMRAINRRTRGLDRATDVLSFPALAAADKPLTKERYPYEYDDALCAVALGSVLISNAAVRRQAGEYGHSAARERAYLFVHGTLHLLGYDHETESDRAIMRQKEEEILFMAGLTREQAEPE